MMTDLESRSLSRLYRQNAGQSLIELVVGIGIGVLFITAAIGIITVALKLDFQNKYSQTAGELAQQMLEQTTIFANADWHNIDSLTSETPYHLATSSGFLTIESGSSTVLLGGDSYDVSFITSPVYRDSLDAFVASEAGALDPSTLKITAVAEQTGLIGRAPRVELSQYLTRIRDRVVIQSDWSNGSSSLQTISITSNSFTTPATFHNATNTAWGDQTADPQQTMGQLTMFDPSQNLQNTAGSGIDLEHHYAWNDVIGWIDFIYYHNILVGPKVTGYAYSTAVGDIALDCATTPNGNICVTPPGSGIAEFSVAQDAGGILSGFGWNDSLGWISFNCSNNGGQPGGCATNTPCPAGTSPCTAPSGGLDYYVYIDGSGYFHGTAWSDAAGWISFNSDTCDVNTNGYTDTGDCGGDDATTPIQSYSVRTGAAQTGLAELESMTFDTGRVGGAALNTILWQGTQPTGTRVEFQIASSNCSNGANNAPTCSTGTWSFIGPDGTSGSTYAPTSFNVPERISRAYHNNARYFRYRVLLWSDSTLTSGPTVRDVILNWSH